MKVVLIGAGNLATQLGKALVRRHACEVVQVYSRTETSASALAMELHTEAVTSINEVCIDADLYVVALKDSAFTEIADQLVQGREHALFVHTAGSLPMSVWEGKASRYGVFYPMQTFSKQRDVDFSSIPIFIESNHIADRDLLMTLAQCLSERVMEANSSQRRALHLSAVFACNFTNHMYAICEQLLVEAGLPFESMLPLIDETAAKAHVMSPRQAQTGPAVRYDENVIRKHVEALALHPQWQELYEKLSKSIHLMGKD